MKIIDLLLKIANGEEVPKKVKLLDNKLLPKFQTIILNEDLKQYEFSDGTEFNTANKFHLNIKVEVIEGPPTEETISEEQVLFNKLSYENRQYILNKMKTLNEDTPKDKKIEKIDISNFPKRNNSLKKTALKLNEIIDKINGEE